MRLRQSEEDISELTGDKVKILTMSTTVKGVIAAYRSVEFPLHLILDSCKELQIEITPHRPIRFIRRQFDGNDFQNQTENGKNLSLNYRT